MHRATPASDGLRRKAPWLASCSIRFEYREGTMGVMTTRSGGSRFAALLGGIGLGAAVMYVLDPQGGRRRRALARDKAVSLANKTSKVVSARSRDLANRAKGVAAEARSIVVEGGDR